MNRKIYVQCGSGARAVLAARQLKDIGFTNVTAAPFNLADWQKKKYPFKTVDQK
jgi:rhodanese-related sulfurtransferase